MIPQLNRNEAGIQDSCWTPLFVLFAHVSRLVQKFTRNVDGPSIIHLVPPLRAITPHPPCPTGFSRLRMPPPLLIGEEFGVAAPLDGHLENSLRLILTEKSLPVAAEKCGERRCGSPWWGCGVRATV